MAALRILATHPGRLVLVLGVLLLVAIATGVLSFSAGPASATGPEMNLLVPQGASCDSQTNPTTCDVAVGATFSLKIEGSGVDPATIGVFATLVYIDGLTYAPASCEEEILFEPKTLPVCGVNDTGAVGHGNVGLGSPFAAWTNAPDLVQMPGIACEMPGSNRVVLPADQPPGVLDAAGGAKFKTIDNVDVLLKTAGEAEIHDPLQGRIVVPIVDSLVVNCVESLPGTPDIRLPETGLAPTEGDDWLPVVWGTFGAMAVAFALGVTTIAWRARHM